MSALLSPPALQKLCASCFCSSSALNMVVDLDKGFGQGCELSTQSTGERYSIS